LHLKVAGVAIADTPDHPSIRIDGHFRVEEEMEHGRAAEFYGAIVHWGQRFIAHE
jgi:hypothetical protein